MALIVISDPACFEGESSLINQLFAAGMKLFHLRKPGIDELSYKRLISQIDAQHHNRIALHQFHELRHVFPLITRLHYPEQLRHTDFETDLKNMEGYTLSTSLHHLSDLKILKGFDYTFYGPVFNSISKPGYTGLSMAELVLPDQHRGTKIIALGGITHKNMQEVKLLGFDGMAILGTVWANKTTAIESFKLLLINYNNHYN